MPGEVVISLSPGLADREAVATWYARFAWRPSRSTRATRWPSAQVGGTVVMWEWIGDGPAITFQLLTTQTPATYT
jgi:hypothetical protein